MRVIDLLKDLENQSGKYGIEIEVEGSQLQIPRNNYWKVEEDGSLRANPECCEYVLRQPLDYNEAIEAVKWLNTKHVENDSSLNWSFRCSTHVHVNVQKWSVTKLLRFIYLYYLFENMLVRWSGKEREGNRFCLRIQDSYHISYIIADAFLSNLQNIAANHIRYAALNIGSLHKYGSIEFRSLEGTTDVERISLWLHFIECLEAAAERNSIENYLAAIRVSPLEVAKQVFHDFLPFIIHEDWENDTLYNASLNISMIELERDVINNEKDFDFRLQQQQQKRKALKEQAEREAAEAQRKQVEALAQEAVNQLGQQPMPMEAPVKPARKRPAVRKQAAIPQANLWEAQNQLIIVDYAEG